jgi:predicted DNA-binding transcriptional regulator AlpA
MFRDFDDVRWLRDADIARITSMSKSWVRKQRMLKKQGHPHQLTIDPVRIGRSVRYPRELFEAWLAERCGSAKAP